MDRLTEGQVFLDGIEISGFNKKQMTAYRRYDIGFVFQFYNVYSVALTFVFAILIDLILRFKVDAIDMAESMKAIE